ncbi:unnamed protein product [Gadus morhua 'NCC']
MLVTVLRLPAKRPLPVPSEGSVRRDNLPSVLLAEKQKGRNNHCLQGVARGSTACHALEAVGRRQSGRFKGTATGPQATSITTSTYKEADRPSKPCDLKQAGAPLQGKDKKRLKAVQECL